MGSEERRSNFFPYALALGALLLASIVTLFLLPIARCPRCSPMRDWMGGKAKSTGCTACDNTGRLSPWLAWMHRGEGSPEFWKK
jgi:hypothetical protein